MKFLKNMEWLTQEDLQACLLFCSLCLGSYRGNATGAEA